MRGPGRRGGAIAAGHPLTAEAGARILAEGGNAVDACVAASAASWVAESPLTGPGAGGFLLVHRARDRSTRVLDCFATAPGLGAVPHARAELQTIDVGFGAESDTLQVFRIGAAACAVPGLPAGLGEAHRRHGRLPWAALLRPAVELARAGVEITRAQGSLHALLDSILRHGPEGRRVYSLAGRRLAAGDRLCLPDLADTLETLAAEGPQALYTGELARATVDHLAAAGGEITARDLAGYRVVVRRPVEAGFGRTTFCANPPPSSGGVLIAYGLRLLDRLGLGGAPGSAPALARLAAVLAEQQRARGGRFATDLHRGGLAAHLLADSSIEAGLARIAADPDVPYELSSPSGTTHVSVVDGDGNAAALSASTGAGSGVIVPGTGIHLNNMLGEPDLNPAGKPPRPGRRLTSMMAPAVVLEDGRVRLVVGSAGSARLRGAILQVIVDVVGHGLGVEEAIGRPRVHVEDGQLHCEGGHHPDALAALEAAGVDVMRWRRRNLFFGGVAAVEVRPDGSVGAAGDPRRGGHGVVVAAG